MANMENMARAPIDMELPGLMIPVRIDNSPLVVVTLTGMTSV